MAGLTGDSRNQYKEAAPANRGGQSEGYIMRGGEPTPPSRSWKACQSESVVQSPRPPPQLPVRLTGALSVRSARIEAISGSSKYGSDSWRRSGAQRTRLAALAQMPAG